MEKKQAAMGTYVMPKPPVIVSCRGKDGQNNALVVAYASNCSYDPPMAMVGIVPSRHSYKLIKESGCFIINLASPHNKEAYDYLGSHSGRDEDKLKKLKMNIADGKVVDAPILLDCPVNIECTIVDSIVTGSHEMFIGKVEYVHAPSDSIAEDGKIDFSKIELL
ncbi:MAG: flavin reductase family protein [Clostridia bacterium]|nr:flavin reductase family protein [Clostridia bacterium]